ncbi:putative DUF4340 domain-containing protein [Gammaproteobacteria bacterium]
MRKSIQLLLLGLATGITGYWVMENPPSTTSSMVPGEGRFLPNLASQLDQVQRIRIEKGADHWTLLKTEGRWKLEEKDGYPADRTKIRKILLGMAQWERLDPKTRKPENYPRLGLAESGDGAEGARRVELQGSAGTLASIRLGKRQPAKAGEGLSEFYVKTTEDSQVWLAQGRLPDLDGLRAFLNTSLLKIDRERIREVRWRLAESESLRLFRSDAKAQNFLLDGLKTDEKLKSGYGVDGVADRLAGLMLEDVRPASAFNDATPMLSADLATFEGLSVHLDLLERDGKHWARLQAKADELPSSKPPAPSAGEAATEPPKEAPKPPVKPVADEVGEFNGQWAGWVFALPEWQVDGLKKRRDDLVEPPPTQDKPTATTEAVPAPTTDDNPPATSPVDESAPEPMR